jgi:hypothetical protein
MAVLWIPAPRFRGDKFRGNDKRRFEHGGESAANFNMERLIDSIKKTQEVIA